MHLSEGERQLLAQLVSEWEHAEEALKLGEMLTFEQFQPGVHELRYAGRKLILFIKMCEAPHDESKGLKLIEEARADCDTARYDATDWLVLMLSNQLKVYREELGADLIKQFQPELPQLIRDLSTLSDLIVNSRKSLDKRPAIYEKIDNGLLRDCILRFRVIEQNEAEIIELKNQKETDEQNQVRKDRFRFWVMAVIGLVAAVAAVAALI